jgi:hypothetical protein
MGEETKMYKVLVGRPERRKSLGRRKSRWDLGTKIDLREIGWAVWSGFPWLSTGTYGGLL